MMYLVTDVIVIEAATFTAGTVRRIWESTHDLFQPHILTDTFEQQHTMVSESSNVAHIWKVVKIISYSYQLDDRFPAIITFQPISTFWVQEIKFVFVIYIIRSHLTPRMEV